MICLEFFFEWDDWNDRKNKWFTAAVQPLAPLKKNALNK